MMRSRRFALGLATVATLAVVAVAAATSAGLAASASTYEVTALSGTLTQVAPVQAIAPADEVSARAALSFSVLNRPRAVLSSSRTATLPLRYTGSGTWSLSYYFGRGSSSGTCGDSLTLTPQALRSARVRLALAPARRVRVTVVVPVIGIAPYDCMASIDHEVLTRTYPRSTFQQKRFTLRLAVSKKAGIGSEFMSMTWSWKLTLAFRRL